MDLPILYEDKNYAVIAKPAGLVVHADGKTVEPSVVDWVIEKYPSVKKVGEPFKLSSGETIDRPGIVHRLDRDTSGVLIIAKNQPSFEYLKEQFKKHRVKKIYHAFVYGDIKEDEGVIDRPIGRNNKDFRLWSAQRGARGELREAVTNYKVLVRSPVATLVEVTPKTGRTHQIRVHFKAINFPVICDRLYAPKRKPELGFERLALHGVSIEFLDMYGKKIKVEAPYPEDFVAAKKALEETAEKREG
ncbi:RluA family pseudouridine synthase [Candidatus Parcubacteria bacterium]|nr:RluA family pseudouridine synthase [Candidatus Parcubacteria bacterium]